MKDTNTEPNPDCMLNVEPLYQCCCTCIYLKAVHFHCCTNPKPTDEQKKSAGIEGKCVCGVQKGWACVYPEDRVVYDNWPQHSVGCECHTTIEQFNEWNKQGKDLSPNSSLAKLK